MIIFDLRLTLCVIPMRANRERIVNCKPDHRKINVSPPFPWMQGKRMDTGVSSGLSFAKSAEETPWFPTNSTLHEPACLNVLTTFDSGESKGCHVWFRRHGANVFGEFSTGRHRGPERGAPSRRVAATETRPAERCPALRSGSGELICGWFILA